MYITLLCTQFVDSVCRNADTGFYLMFVDCIILVNIKIVPFICVTVVFSYVFSSLMLNTEVFMKISASYLYLNTFVNTQTEKLEYTDLILYRFR
jgi:hypothetical protein